jgi:high-affinity nickel permease
VFGLDHQIAGLGSGATFLIVAGVAALLGLRHATDPDHLTAVSTLVASGEERGPGRAGVLGLSWGLGHATTLFALGLPIVVAGRYLPDPIQQGAEAAIGVVIMWLAIRLLLRWRRGELHDHPHAHSGALHRHPHAHGAAGGAVHRHSHGALGRSPLQAYGIGALHGVGGSAGIGVLLLAAIPNHVEAVTALLIFALFTAISMALVSTAFGYAISRGPILARFARVAPVLGLASLAFGAWYALGAVNAVPYVF